MNENQLIKFTKWIGENYEFDGINLWKFNSYRNGCDPDPIYFNTEQLIKKFLKENSI